MILIPHYQNPLIASINNSRIALYIRSDKDKEKKERYY